MEKKTLLIIAGIAIFLIGGLIFLASNEKTSTDPVGGVALKMAAYAEELGLDVEKFKVDMESDEAGEAVLRGIAEGNAAGVQSTPTILINGAPISDRTEGSIQALIDEAVAAGQKQELPEGYHTKGADEPYVVIEEYSDLQCPACRSAFPLLKKIIEDNGDTTALVYKHFPLTQIHANATAAARATEAAAMQGKFWEMHDLLFERQRDWN